LSEANWLSRKELAAKLNVSLSTLDKMRDDGMPTVMIYKNPRFDFSAVLQWIEEQSRARVERSKSI